MSVLRLKEFRLKAKYTQKQLSELLNVTQSHYSRWENGSRLPDAKQIIELCHVLKCTPNDLFGMRAEYEVATMHWDE